MQTTRRTADPAPQFVPAPSAPSARRCAFARTALAIGPLPPPAVAAPGSVHHRRRPARALPRLACGLLLVAACAVAAAPAVAAPDAAPAQQPHGDAPACAPRAGPSLLAPAEGATLLAPADGATLHGAGARFAWSRDAAPRRRLQVARDDAFEDLVVDRGIDAGDPGEAIVALPPGDYRWRSVAERPGAAMPGGDGACAEVRRFTLRPFPAAPRPSRRSCATVP